MKLFFNSVLALILCFLLIFSFTGCKQIILEEPTSEKENVSELPTVDIWEPNETATQQQQEYHSQSQGIVVVKSLPIYKDEATSGSPEEAYAGILVYNNSQKTLNYMKITADYAGNIKYTFIVTVLPPGESCIVQAEGDVKYIEPLNNLYKYTFDAPAFFPEEPSVMADSFSVYGVDGILSVENISGMDVTENVVLYFKDYDGTQFTSGITYSVTVSGGIKNGEIKQISAPHYKSKGSMLVRIALFAEVN